MEGKTVWILAGDYAETRGCRFFVCSEGVSVFGGSAALSQFRDKRTRCPAQKLADASAHHCPVILITIYSGRTPVRLKL